MSTISVNWGNADRVIDLYNSNRMELSNSAASIRSIKSYRCMSGKGFSSIYRAMDKVIASLEDEKADIENLKRGYTAVLKVYKTGETDVADQFAKENPFAWSSKDTWKAFREGGIIGNVISAIGGFVTDGWSSDTILDAGESLLGIIGGFASKWSGGAGVKWKDALFGLDSGLTGLNTSSAGKTFWSSINKQFGEDLSFGQATTVGDKIKVGTTWGGYALSLLSNFFDNKAEFAGEEDATGRMLAETGIETVVDIGLGAISTAAVSALATIVGATAAPAVLIGAGAVAVTWAANGICKWLTGGDDIAETAANLVCDAGEAIGKGFKAVTSWGKSLFSSVFG